MILPSTRTQFDAILCVGRKFSKLSFEWLNVIWFANYTYDRAKCNNTIKKAKWTVVSKREFYSFVSFVSVIVTISRGCSRNSTDALHPLNNFTTIGGFSLAFPIQCKDMKNAMEHRSKMCLRLTHRYTCSIWPLPLSFISTNILIRLPFQFELSISFRRKKKFQNWMPKEMLTCMETSKSQNAPDAF